jgi:hypothetical protein
MNADDFDIADLLDWDEELPRPKWDLIESWVDSHPVEDQRNVWTVALRQWLSQLGEALGEEYATNESDEFLILAPNSETAGALIWFAGKCRTRLQTIMGSVAQFTVAGKQVAIAFDNSDDYYRYVSPYFPEGEHGLTGGLQIREGYSHIAMQGANSWMLENTLAHELTHAALQHLAMPQWLEEGLAQMVEHDMTGRGLLELTVEIADRHKRYWGKHGLDDFWRGEGFSRSGKVQELSYQLAEVLIRLLVEDSRPRWFGLVREPQQRFFAFLAEVNAVDCGEESCRQCLGFGLSDLASRFLGEGDWSPSL